MRPKSLLSLPDFAQAALAASNVGTWQFDPTTGRVRCDAVMARIFGLSAAEAERGAFADRLREAVLPEDQPIFDHNLDAVRRHGGLIVVEYRVSPVQGVTRRVLARGRYEPARGAHEAMARGIIIDITESKLDGHVEDEAFFVHPAERRADTALLRAVDLAITLHREVALIDDEVPSLSEATRIILTLLGRRLARDIPRDEVI